MSPALPQEPRSCSESLVFAPTCLTMTEGGDSMLRWSPLQRCRAQLPLPAPAALIYVIHAGASLRDGKTEQDRQIPLPSVCLYHGCSNSRVISRSDTPFPPVVTPSCPHSRCGNSGRARTGRCHARPPRQCRSAAPDCPRPGTPWQQSQHCPHPR